MPTMQVLLSIIFKSYLTAKFLHHEDNENNTFSGAASWGQDCTLPDNVGLPVLPRARGGVSPDICKFIAQGTVQLYATASHRLDVAANIESIY